jgi:hypothetical protein
MHEWPSVIEAFLDRETRRVIFFSTAAGNRTAVVEVVDPQDRASVTIRGSVRPETHVPFSQDLSRLEALMDELDQRESA